MPKKCTSRGVSHVKSFIRGELKTRVESDRRIRLAKLNEGKVTEYTLQAIIWDHLSRFVGDSWLLSIEDRIPGTDMRADLVLCKLTRGGEVDLRHGTIAMEVKPKGTKKDLVADVKKLTSYIRRARSPVNFGVLVYLSPQDVYERYLKRRARSLAGRKIAVLRLHPTA